MAGKDMTLRMVMKLAANDFTRGLNGIQKQLQGLGNYLKTAFAVGSVVSFGREMIKWTKEFEDAMARAKAVSNATADGFKMMNDEALRLGATTRYTSVQVAQTLEVLTRNGLSATNATRVLADTLKLAQANAVELADAGNMITNTMNMFGLSVDKSGDVIDKLSYTASHSATDLTNLYEAMVNAAPMAHALGININEVSAALGALANVGVKGPDAGTQLRQFLQRLTDPLAMKKMQKLTGFSFDEEFIRTEGLEGVLKKLQSMALTVSQLNEIFTVRSSKSIIQLMNAMQNFENLLVGVGDASGTATRMFNEGVGSMRYELDILRSMWQNFMITLGSSTSGPILGIVKFFQNFITSLNSGKLALLQLIPVLMLFGRKGIASYQSLTKYVLAWANASKTAVKLEMAERQKAYWEEQLRTKQLDAAQRKSIALHNQKRKAIITALKAEQAAANAVKSTLASIGWGALIIAVEVLITKLVAMNAEIRNANKAVAESKNEQQNLINKTNMLVEMIGNGKDKDSLNGALAEAERMFGEFAGAIRSAAIEAGNTGNYEKLKNLLKDIASLQTKVMATKANQELVDATSKKFSEAIRKSSVGMSIEYKLSSKGFDKSGISNVFKQIGDIILRNNDNLDKAVTDLGIFLKSMDVDISDNSIDKLVKENTAATRKSTTGTLFSSRDVNNDEYQNAVTAYNTQKGLTEQVTRDEYDIKWRSAIDAYNMAAGEAALAYKAGSEEYKEAMATAAAALKSAVGDILKNLDYTKQEEYNNIQKQWGKSSAVSGGGEGGSGSKKKTTQDKFNDLVQEYIDEVKKIDSQLKNGVITQKEYNKALNDAQLSGIKAISGVEDLDKMLKGLPASSKDAGNALAGMIGDYRKKVAEGILLDFDQKQTEINNQYENGPKDAESLKAFNDAMDDLATETMDELTKLGDLNEIIPQLTQAMKDLFDLINFGVTSQKEQTRTEQLDQLNKDTKIDVKEPKLKVILSPDDKSVEGMKQNIQRALDEENFDINIQIENDETILDATQDKVKEVEKAIDDLQTKIATNDDSISLIKEDAIERLHTLKNYLMELMNQAKTMEDKVELSKLIVKLNGDIKTLSSNTLDNISSMASAFDRLKDSVKDIAEAFDMDIEFEGLEKGITVINAIIQAIESVKEIMETFQAFQELANKRQLASNAQLTLSNATVAASESTKALAAAEGAIANGAEIASASAAAQANNKQALSNYNVAASEATKAAAAGTSAVAQGAESVAKTPYVGAILAVAAAGAIATALIAAFSKVKGFAHGGFIPGTSYSGDKNLIRANSGELVLTRGDQRTLYRAIKTGNFNGAGGNVNFVIRGDQLIGVLDNHRRIHHNR